MPTICNRQTNINNGISFIETLWFSYANRIIENAIKIYKLNEEQIRTLTEKFLKRGDYKIILK
jgi:hypothetical protein